MGRTLAQCAARAGCCVVLLPKCLHHPQSGSRRGPYKTQQRARPPYGDLPAPRRRGVELPRTKQGPRGTGSHHQAGQFQPAETRARPPTRSLSAPCVTPRAQRRRKRPPTSPPNHLFIRLRRTARTAGDLGRRNQLPRLVFTLRGSCVASAASPEMRKRPSFGGDLLSESRAALSYATPPTRRSVVPSSNSDWLTRLHPPPPSTPTASLLRLRLRPPHQPLANVVCIALLHDS